MKPAQLFTGYQTADLTEGKVHRISGQDGSVRFAVLFPETWEPIGERREVPTVSGTMQVQFYRVLTWREHLLELKS